MSWFSKISASTIKSKVTIIFASVIVVVVLVLLIFTGYYRRTNALNQAKQIALEQARTYANVLKREFDEPMNTSVDMVEALITIKDNTTTPYQRRDLIISYLKNVLDDDNSYSSVYTIWEPNTLDESDSLFNEVEGSSFTGRFVPNIIKDEKGTISVEAMNNNDDFQGDYYVLPKKTFKPHVTNPIKLKFEGREKLFIVFSAPVVHDGMFFAVSGLTIPMNKIQSWLEQRMPSESHITLVGDNGQIIADNKVSEIAGKSLKNITNDWRDIMKAKSDEQDFVSYNEETYELEVFVPFRIAETTNVWGVNTTFSLKQSLQAANSEILYTAFIGLLLLLLAVIIVAVFISFMLHPLADIATIAEKVASGTMEESFRVKTTGSEVARITNALNSIVRGVNSLAGFALQIGKGDLDAQFDPISEDDVLGNSLLQMQESLIVAQDERKRRRVEDEKRTWATYGLAKFSDILRQHSDNITRLSSLIISNLVDYLEANQGGLFIFNDEDPVEVHMELVASYAYNRQKNLHKKIPLRVGLVGMCAVEKKTKFITDIPGEYINITSGLGEAAPKSLLLVPLVLNDEIFGVIELASFKQFESSEIDFVEQLAENISSTLASVKTSQRTSELLAQSQKQSEKMAMQEEGMRQNLRDLLATQEEMERRHIEQDEVIQRFTTTQNQMESTQKTLLQREHFIKQIVEISPEVILTVTSSGEIIEANERVYKLTGYEAENLVQKNITLLLNELDVVSLKEGQIFEAEVTRKDDSRFVAHCSVGQVRVEEKVNYLFFILDVTSQVERFGSLEKENAQLLSRRDDLTEKNEDLTNECKLLYARLDEAKNAILLEQKRQESLREELEIRTDEFQRLKDEFNRQNGK